MDTKLKITIMPVAPLGANCFIISNPSGNALVIDPGGEAEKISNFITKNNLTLISILCTHGHFDHVGGAGDLQKKYNVPLYIHKDDEELMKNTSETLKRYGFNISVTQANATNLFAGDDTVMFDDTEIKVLHTPGHTAGGVCYYLPAEETLISGDTLFSGSVGRTDLQGGSFKELENSIKTKLYKLPDNTKVYPGHDRATTIGNEKRSNAYVRG